MWTPWSCTNGWSRPLIDRARDAQCPLRQDVLAIRQIIPTIKRISDCQPIARLVRCLSDQDGAAEPRTRDKMKSLEILVRLASDEGMRCMGLMDKLGLISLPAQGRARLFGHGRAVTGWPRDAQADIARELRSLDDPAPPAENRLHSLYDFLREMLDYRQKSSDLSQSFSAAHARGTREYRQIRWRKPLNPIAKQSHAFVLPQ